MSETKDYSAVRKPSDIEIVAIADAFIKHLGGDVTTAFESREDLIATLKDCAIAVFPNYCTDSVGYHGVVVVILWGACSETHTILNMDNSKKVLRVSFDHAE